MAFIRYKKISGAKYAYEVEAYWDPKLKKPRQKTKYLGKVVDEKKKKIEKVLYSKHQEKQILDLGDIHLLSHVYKHSGLEKIIEASFAEYSFFIKAFIFNRIVFPLPLKSLYYWVSTNVLKEEGDISQLTSQNISEMLAKLGEEERIKEFLQNYLKQASPTATLLFDVTAMPTLISSMLSEWGYADSNIEYKIGLLLVSDKNSHLPLFFKLVPGNIVSVTLLDETLNEIQAFGISRPFLILDRGFFSRDNLVRMKEEKIGFIIGLPASNSLFNELIERTIPVIQTPSNAFLLNGNYYFGSVEKIKMDAIPLYAYIIFNPERRVREEKEFYSKLLDKAAYLESRKRRRKIAGRFIEYKYGKSRMNEEEIKKELMRKGTLILLSTKKMSCVEALQLYYSRDLIEKNFRYFKSDLNILPIRLHRDSAIRGYILLMFLSLYFLLQLRKVKLDKMSLTDAFLLLRMVKKKIYDDMFTVVGIAKEQKEIFERFGCIMPKSSGN